MKYFSAIPFLVLGMLAQAEEPSVLRDLADLQWKNRIIVINQPTDEDAISAILEKHEADVDDRDIAWFILKDDRIVTNYTGVLSEDLSSRTRKQFDAGPGMVILIGKDGGIKYRSDRFDPETLFSTIDAMPMRQTEMRN